MAGVGLLLAAADGGNIESLHLANPSGDVSRWRA
jgi:hypothetical protein